MRNGFIRNKRKLRQIMFICSKNKNRDRNEGQEQTSPLFGKVHEIHDRQSSLQIARARGCPGANDRKVTIGQEDSTPAMPSNTKYTANILQ